MKTKDQQLLEEAYKKVLNEISGFDEGDSASDAQKHAPQELKDIEQDLMSGEFGSAYGKLEKLLNSLKPLVDDIFTKEDSTEEKPKGVDSEEFLKQRMSLKFDEEENPNN
jgi:hypothetical protein